MEDPVRFRCSRVHTRTRVLCLLDEAGHVLQEQVVHVLLIHLPQLAVPPHVHLRGQLFTITPMYLVEFSEENVCMYFRTWTTCC